MIQDRTFIVTFNFIITEKSNVDYKINNKYILYKEIIKQTKKIVMVSGALKKTIWRNKHLRTEAKTRIYKTCVGPILIYAIEITADNNKTK